MALPTCPKCGGHNFDSSSLNDLNNDTNYSDRIFYCKDCGHIIGCGVYT
jgi:hypothetical protein